MPICAGLTTGARAVNLNGVTGFGIKVGIIDTGDRPVLRCRRRSTPLAFAFQNSVTRRFTSWWDVARGHVVTAISLLNLFVVHPSCASLSMCPVPVQGSTTRTQPSAAAWGRAAASRTATISYKITATLVTHASVCAPSTSGETAALPVYSAAAAYRLSMWYVFV